MPTVVGLTALYYSRMYEQFNFESKKAIMMGYIAA